MIVAHGRHLVFHLSRLPEVGRLYWSHSLRNFGQNLVAIFVPIYLYQIGYSLSDVLFYMTSASLAWMVFVYPAMQLMSRLGANRLMALSMLLNVVWFLLLVTLPDQHWPLWLIGLVWGAFVAPYWSAFRYAFAEAVRERKAGRYVAGSSALLLMASGLAPATGGIIATELGINVIYVAGGLIFFLASLPLIKGTPLKPPQPLQMKRFRIKPFARDYAANFGSTIDDAVQEFAWPFLIFLFLPSYAGVGILSSLAIVTSILTALYVGRREETKGAKRYLREGAAATSISNVLRLMATAPGHVAGVNFLTGVANALVGTSFSTRYYEHISKDGGYEYLFGMQTFSAFGWVLLFTNLYLLSLVLEPRETLLAAVLVAVPASLLIARMR